MAVTRAVTGSRVIVDQLGIHDRSAILLVAVCLDGGSDVGGEVAANLAFGAVLGGDAFTFGWASEFAHLLSKRARLNAQHLDELGGRDEGSAVLVQVIGEVVDDSGERFG